MRGRQFGLMEALESRLLLAAAASSEITFTTTPAAMLASVAQGLNVTYDGRGLATLRYNGDTLVDANANGGDAFRVAAFKRVKSDGSIVYGYDWQNLQTVSMNTNTNTVKWSFDWGYVSCQYQVEGDNRLDLKITVKNDTGADTIAGVDVAAMGLHFPAALAGDLYPRVGFGFEGPNVQGADYGSGVLAMANEDVVKELYAGLYTYTDTPTSHHYDLWVGSMPHDYDPSAWPKFERSVGPGQVDSYNISLRFGGAGVNPLDLAGDVFTAYAAAYPYQMNWADHRPIGTLHPASSEPQNRTGTNPRGWFNDPTIDVTTPAGLEIFRTRLLAYADTAIGVLKANNTQGCITWDLEGEQYPHAITYIGDPRLATTLAPELAYRNVVGEYFAKFIAAGLRVGVTVRPQQFSIGVDGIPRQDPVADEAALLIDKIRYAHDNWGATLFYIDSNSNTDGDVLAQVTQRFPDVLLIPEHEGTRIYGFTIPYEELRQGTTGTPDFVRRSYPNANTVIYVPEGDIDGKRAELLESVKRGDILMFRAWWDDVYNAKVNSIYQEAFDPPATPGVPVVSVANAAVTLTWNAVPTAVAYNVKRGVSASGPFEIVGPDVDGTTFTDTGLVNGQTYYYVISAISAGGESGNSAPAVMARPQAGPTIATGPTATTNPVTGVTTNLSVLGADDGGEGNLTYTWSVVGTPPMAVAFSVNGTNSAKNTTVRFSAAGSYTFNVVIRDVDGLTVSLTLGVSVVATMAKVIVATATMGNLAGGMTRSFTASVMDQFGRTITPNGAIVWSLSAGSLGTINATTGVYTAPAGYTGTATIRATCNGIVGAMTVMIISAYQINVGGAGQGSFAPDSGYVGGSTMTTGAAITTAGVANAASQVVYQSQRYGNFVYQVSNLAPGTQFTLRLHFAELYWTSAGQRRFDVAINGTTVLSNFDVFAGAGGRYKAVVREFVATADAQGNIQIKFSSRVDRAMLSGLELVART